MLPYTITEFCIGLSIVVPFTIAFMYMLFSFDPGYLKRISKYYDKEIGTDDTTYDTTYVIDEMIELFDKYRDDFGVCNHDFPKGKCQENQCEFEDRFCELICKYMGHTIGPNHRQDQHGKPEHDFCYRCDKLRIEIEEATKNNG